MESKTHAAKARAKAAKEKAIKAADKASRARSELQQVLDKIGVLEGKVALEMATADIQRERVIELEKALAASEAAEKEAEERIEVVEQGPSSRSRWPSTRPSFGLWRDTRPLKPLKWRLLRARLQPSSWASTSTRRK